MSESSQEPSNRQWSTLRLQTGFYLQEVVRSVIQFADTDERKQAITKVHTLIESNCIEVQEWQDSICLLAKLCREHPDAYQESGTWYNGAPCILSLALAKEAATASLWKLYPSLHTEWEVEARIYKCVKYLFRAMAQRPECAMNCLTWVEREFHQPSK